MAIGGMRSPFVGEDAFIVGCKGVFEKIIFIIKFESDSSWLITEDILCLISSKFLSQH